MNIIFQLYSTLANAYPGFSRVEIVSWKILQRTEKKAVFVETPGGSIWLSPRHLEILGRHRSVDRDSLPKLMKCLESFASDHGQSLVPVSKAGTGPSTKSHKFKYQIFQIDVDGNGRSLERTTTLPISQIVYKEGKGFAPRWLLSKKLEVDERVYGRWPGLEVIEKQFLDGFDKLKATEEAKLKASAEQHRRIEEAEVERLNTLEKVKAEKSNLIPEQSRSSPKVHQPDQTLENCTVTFPDWVGTKKRFHAVDKTLTGCVVKFYGAKREIITPDGKSITKLASPNLVISQ